MKSKTLLLIGAAVAAFVFRKKIAEVASKLLKKKDETSTPTNPLIKPANQETPLDILVKQSEA